MSQPISLSPQALQTQREAMNMVQRERKILLILAVVGLIAIFVLLMLTLKSLPIYSALLLYFGFYGLVRVAMNWRQWAALIKYQVRCPHCNQLLAEQVEWLKSPTPKCPRCGERALATLQQLEGKE